MAHALAPTQHNILLESGTNEVEFIEFFLGGESYGVNVSKVQRVIALSICKITTMAGAPPGVLGVIQVADKPVLLIDLRTALAMPQPETATKPERQLVMVTRFNKRTTGFLIDGVSKIHRTSWTEFEPMTSSFGSDGSGYTTGTVKIQERIILILDLERLMLNYSNDGEQRPRAEHLLVADEDKKKRRAAVKLIYAEDSKMIRKMTTETLEAAGYTNVAVFENGADADRHITFLRTQALAENKTLRDYLDLILTDIEMPKMDGLTLCKRVKNAGGDHIPAVIVYSSLINEEMARKCESVGADAQMSKPHGDEIVGLIDQLCHC